MSQAQSDPLLRAATILINIAMVVFAAATIFLLLVTPIFLLHSDRPIETGAVSMEFVPAAVPQIIMPLAIVMVALAFQFLRTLRKIVVTVGKGNPFTTGNADRLRAMAWLALVMQAVSVVAWLIDNWEVKPSEPGGIELTLTGFAGLLVALVLFILARVFRVGAEMRDELEGTV